MYLNDSRIIELSGSGHGSFGLPSPLISPFNRQAVGPVSVDLRTGRKFASPQILHAHVIRDGVRVREASSLVVDGDALCKPGEGIEIVLEPGQVVACHSVERVNLPPWLLGTVYIRSSYAREWLTHSTAQLIQPGFQGSITFELCNTGPRAMSIRSDERIMQLTFCQLIEAAGTPYGLQAGSKYQGQEAELNSRRKQGEAPHAA